MMDIHLWANGAFDNGVSNTLPWFSRLRGLKNREEIIFFKAETGPAADATDAPQP
jgi:hypothetical protein